ncbi:MAG TPA: DUF6505 family protein [Geminicoccaceae bacterium]|nr:DUF6505 family protein [Geminicoccaceae bacterium]
MRLPRTIRFDDSDERVFERAAAPDEWAVSGAFAFADADPAAVTGGARQAFANGFLGTASFGWSTFVAVAGIAPDEFEQVVRALAAHFVARYGAPGIAAALPVARAEAEFAAGLCDGHPVNTLLAVERAFGPDGIRERFRAIERPRAPAHARIWTIVDGDGP